MYGRQGASHLSRSPSVVVAQTKPSGHRVDCRRRININISLEKTKEICFKDKETLNLGFFPKSPSRFSSQTSWSPCTSIIVIIPSVPYPPPSLLFTVVLPSTGVVGYCHRHHRHSFLKVVDKHQHYQRSDSPVSLELSPTAPCSLSPSQLSFCHPRARRHRPRLVTHPANISTHRRPCSSRRWQSQHTETPRIHAPALLVALT